MYKFFEHYIKSFLSLNSLSRYMLFIYMIQSISAGVAFFIAIYLDIHLHINVETIGLLVSLFAGGNLLGSFISAKILDKSNPFTISLYSLILQGCSFIFIALNQSIFSIGTAMFILGASGYAYVVASEFLITDLSGSLEKNRAKAISFINISSNLGVGLGGVLVSFFSKNHSVFLLVGIGVLLLFLSVYYLKEKRTIQYDFKQSDTKETVSKSENFLAYCLSLFVIFFLGLIFAQQRVSYSLYLEQNFGETAVSSLLLTNSILIILFLPSINMISERYNKYKMMGIGGVLLGGGMSLYQFTSAYSLVFLICIITTVGEMLGTLLSQLICFQSAKKGQKGRAMGYYKFLYAFGTIIGTSLGGAIQFHYGMNYVWSFCGLLGFVIISASTLPFLKGKKIIYLTS